MPFSMKIIISRQAKKISTGARLASGMTQAEVFLVARGVRSSPQAHSVVMRSSRAQKGPDRPTWRK